MICDGPRIIETRAMPIRFQQPLCRKARTSRREGNTSNQLLRTRIIRCSDAAKIRSQWRLRTFFPNLISEVAIAATIPQSGPAKDFARIHATPSSAGHTLTAVIALQLAPLPWPFDRRRFSHGPPRWVHWSTMERHLRSEYLIERTGLLAFTDVARTASRSATGGFNGLHGSHRIRR